MRTQTLVRATTRNPQNSLTNEFDRQVRHLAQTGYPKLLRMSAAPFLAALEPLRSKLPPPRPRPGRIPFVIVIPNVPIAQAVGRIELKGRRGFTTMEADDISRFLPIDTTAVPDGLAYLVTDIDTGKATLNVTPDAALQSIKKARRSPLTLAEGVALVTLFPDVLKTHNAVSMLGSRCGDRRVTALCVSRGAPRLGWCWAGNPHTWLGSASYSGRCGT